MRTLSLKRGRSFKNIRVSYRTGEELIMSRDSSLILARPCIPSGTKGVNVQAHVFKALVENSNASNS